MFTLDQDLVALNNYNVSRCGLPYKFVTSPIYHNDENIKSEITYHAIGCTGNCKLEIMRNHIDKLKSLITSGIKMSNKNHNNNNNNNNNTKTVRQNINNIKQYHKNNDN